MMGTVRTLAIHPEERHRLAVHEAGHTAVAYFTPEADPLYKVTIIPRGQSLGGTHMLPDKEHHTLPESYLRAQLAVLLAGRAAEKLLAGSVSSGAEDDIKARHAPCPVDGGWLGHVGRDRPDRPAPKGGAPVPRPVHRAAAGVLGHDGGPCGCRGGGAS